MKNTLYFYFALMSLFQKCETWFSFTFKKMQNLPCALATGTGLMFGHVLFAVVIVLLNVVTEFHHLTASWMEWIDGNIFLTDLLD